MGRKDNASNSWCIWFGVKTCGWLVSSHFGWDFEHTLLRSQTANTGGTPLAAASGLRPVGCVMSTFVPATLSQGCYKEHHKQQSLQPPACANLQTALKIKEYSSQIFMRLISVYKNSW